MNQPLSLQDRRVQYAILAIGVIAILVLLFMFVLRGNQAPAVDTATGFPGAPGMPGMGDPGMPPGGPMGPGMPGAPGMGPGMGPEGPMGPGMGGGYDPAGGYMGGGAYGMGGQMAQQPVVEKKAGPKPPRRGDPFRQLDRDVNEAYNHIAKQSREEPSVGDQLVAAGIQRPQLYQTMRAETEYENYLAQLQDGGGLSVAVPPMRMAGIVTGRRVLGILEVGAETRMVQPGETVGPYRVEQVQREKIVLSRPIGRGKRRTIDVPLLDGNPAYGQQVPGGAGDPAGMPPGGAGFPGMPGAFPGPGG